MTKNILSFAFLFISTILYAQDNGFPFGEVTLRDLEMKMYDKDTSAVAVVLTEFGEAYIENGNNFNLIFEYHTRIKILKKAGLNLADIEIPLRKADGKKEVLRDVKASSFTIENGSIKEAPVGYRNIFTENRNKYRDVKKFAIPNVHAGSIVEFKYILESPFIFNFRNWEFQSDIPKVSSEYWALIPGNYLYNITLKGFLKPSKSESQLVKECFTPGGGNKSDCAVYKYAMTNVPAFHEEDYMTAPSNFIAAMNFELAEIKHFNGRVDKVTEEWKDAEKELQLHPDFGVQLKRGKDIVDEHVKIVLKNESDPLIKARKIYDFIKGWYRWNGTYGKFSELGIKKAFEQKSGNVGDINLSLVAALRYAALDVEPVILSTRENGLPIELHPVLSDFNYVVAKVNIGDKVFLADATDAFHPFGILPEHCLNGKGRVLGEKESYWIDLKPADRAKQISVLNLKLGTDGVIRGLLQTSYSGYDAIEQRKKLAAFNSHQDYIHDLDNKLDRIDIKGFEIKNVDDLTHPVVQSLKIEIVAFDSADAGNFMLNLFIMGKWERNPFRSTLRLYPVDFGTPMEMVTVLNLEYPEDFEILNPPDKTALSLPNSGGRFLLEVQQQGNRITLNNSLTINKTIFSSEEYPYLKELFNRIIQIQNGDLIFRKRPESFIAPK
jgi:hypothetical protein